MEDKNMIPYIAHEGIVARLERIIKRLTIALIICVILIFASNALWLYSWCQYDYASNAQQFVSVDGKEGIANYIGNDGTINNGKNSSDNKAEKDTNQEEQE